MCIGSLVLLKMFILQLFTISEKIKKIIGTTFMQKNAAKILKRNESS